MQDVVAEYFNKLSLTQCPFIAYIKLCYKPGYKGAVIEFNRNRHVIVIGVRESTNLLTVDDQFVVNEAVAPDFDFVTAWLNQSVGVFN